MSITVLPVRDVEYQERRTSTYPAPQATPVARDRFEGMHAAKVEIMRAPVNRPSYTGPSGGSSSSSPSPASAPQAPAPASHAGSTSPTAAEIELPNGRIVRVPPGFASSDLERVLAIAASDDGAK